MPAFDTADLQETAARIRAKLDDDQEAIDLLQQLIDSHDAQAEMWREQLDDIQSTQTTIAKAVMLVARNQAKAQAQLGDVQKGLASLYRMQKAQTVSTGKPLGKSMLSQGQGAVTKQAGGMTLAAAQRLGTLAKTIQTTFGSGGGHQMVYNPSLASKMILEGTLSPKQHQVWKRSNRLHDDPYQALQRRKVG